MAFAGITQHLLGVHKPFSHVQPQVFHSPLRPIALEDRSGEKGVPVAGSVPHFPHRSHQPPSRALGRGAALNSDRAAPKPQGTGTGTLTWDGLSCCLSYTQLSPAIAWKALPRHRTESRGQTEPSCLMLLKKAVPAPPHKLFSFGGVRVSSFWYLHS